MDQVTAVEAWRVWASAFRVVVGCSGFRRWRLGLIGAWA